MGDASPFKPHAPSDSRRADWVKGVQRFKLKPPINYNEYLNVDGLLQLQVPQSGEAGPTLEAHDEMTFIVVHQAYELWFKLALHTLDSIMSMLSQQTLPDNQVQLVVSRLDRFLVIQKHMLDQFDILETMSPLEFLDFRDFINPASGFQSAQWRLLEVKLGVKMEQRMQPAGQPFYDKLGEQDRAKVLAAMEHPSLFDLVQQWLERLPILSDSDGFDFWTTYSQCVQRKFQEERDEMAACGAYDEETLAKEIKDSEEREKSMLLMLDAGNYETLLKAGSRRLSFKAFQAAVMINVYQDEPLLQLPTKLLSQLVVMDEKFAHWRYRHALLVHRMLGSKIGTGGSSGHHYLRATVEKSRIFSDYFAMASYLVPRVYLPPLPPRIQQVLTFGP